MNGPDWKVSHGATRGSQRHLQELLNERPEALAPLLRDASASLRGFAAEAIQWVSPLAAEGYREHQDAAFLCQLEQARLAARLSEFWPRRGPVWDGLGIVRGNDGSKGVLLVEAKSHLAEVAIPTTKCGAGERSLKLIERSLRVTKADLGVQPGVNWLGRYYQ